ncbi:3D domain-containing protein [Bacillus sp. XT-2]|uniref:3D domain-containing protein n=1 Tax=Bacillus sp. XT-2 TaxID=2856852 RepID=UPI0021E17268|nr:3D domain-containing protein [Bacillus sp. XT-2]MCV0023465.1 3D domain-containing protein [Bacillus sp. XT-2]MCV0025752.1 3D domain-containing protein [Bacillus sp. XT-2]
MFKKLIDKHKKYVYHRINEMTLFATIGLLGVGLVYSAKNLYTHQDNQVSIKESFYLNKKEVRKKLIHEIDVSRILPRLKSEEEKQAESRKKYLNATITYLTEENKKAAKHTKTKKVQKTNKKRSEDKSASKAMKSHEVVATAYTAFCSTGCIGKTRTGYDVSNTSYYNGKRIIAVDPEIIPLYSLVQVSYEGNSFQAYAIDTGGDIKNNRIDILMDSEQEANAFGRKNVRVSW